MTQNDNTTDDIEPIDALEMLRDEADKAAEKSLDRDESAYDAYERMAGRAQHFIDQIDGDAEQA